MDDNGNRRLDMEEFAKGLHDYGVNMNDDDVTALFSYFDKNSDG
jgi:Ca2+-binding EF-hand superfamily protein